MENAFQIPERYLKNPTKLWQIYEFTCLRSSGTAGTAIQTAMQTPSQKCLNYVTKIQFDI
jgi:hypothetical protein